MKGLIEPAELATRVAEVVEQRLPLLGDGAVVADDLDLPERGEEVFLRNWIPMITERCKLEPWLQFHLTRYHQKYLNTREWLAKSWQNFHFCTRKHSVG